MIDERRTRRWTVASILGMWAAGCTSIRGEAESSAPDGPRPEAETAAASLTKPTTTPTLVVHEWGTFTSLQGSSGIALEGLQHETEAVPAFVHRNVHAEASPWAELGDPSRDVNVSGVRTKMETPVVYFYPSAPMRVSLEVDFTRGLMTHWYPRFASASPEVAPGGPRDITDLDHSTLAWDLDLSPHDGPAPTEIPSVEDDDGWAFARQTGAAYVRTRPGVGEGDAATTEAEHYVFYRGLGSATLPVRVHAHGERHATFVNDGPDAIATGFLVEVEADGGRFAPIGSVEASSSEALVWQDRPKLAMPTLVDELGREVRAALVDAGLFADEADAMVRTWQRAWFSDPGTRVVYLVPRSSTDAILPMRISPAPATLVRVLVARHEFMTPEQETWIAQALADRAIPARRDDATRRLASLGRFLEPALYNARDRAPDPLARQAASDFLLELTPPSP